MINRESQPKYYMVRQYRGACFFDHKEYGTYQELKNKYLTNYKSTFAPSIIPLEEYRPMK